MLLVVQKVQMSGMTLLNTQVTAHDIPETYNINEGIDELTNEQTNVYCKASPCNAQSSQHTQRLTEAYNNGYLIGSSV